MRENDNSEDVKYLILEYFLSKPNNFIKNLSQEFKKVDSDSMIPEMHRYRDTLIQKLYEDLLIKDKDLFRGFNNPVDFIEQTLFEYILNND